MATTAQSGPARPGWARPDRRVPARLASAQAGWTRQAPDRKVPDGRVPARLARPGRARTRQAPDRRVSGPAGPGAGGLGTAAGATDGPTSGRPGWRARAQLGAAGVAGAGALGAAGIAGRGRP